MKWADLQNTHENETALVIGNGPSLRDVPLAFLRSMPSFGTNKIYLLEGFTPTYYCAVNPLVIQQSVERVRVLKCAAKFIAHGYAGPIPGALELGSNGGGFSKNPQAAIAEGYTVTYVCLQLAYYMGFSTVLLVGVDHDYKFEGLPNEQRQFIGKDMNHFAPNYFTGQVWNNPDLERSAEYYQVADEVYRNAGKRIINLTQGTKLDVFEKQDIDAWM